MIDINFNDRAHEACKPKNGILFGLKLVLIPYYLSIGVRSQSKSIVHSTAVRIITKVWKMEMGPL